MIPMPCGPWRSLDEGTRHITALRVDVGVRTNRVTATEALRLTSLLMPPPCYLRQRTVI